MSNDTMDIKLPNSDPLAFCWVKADEDDHLWSLLRVICTARQYQIAMLENPMLFEDSAYTFIPSLTGNTLSMMVVPQTTAFIDVDKELSFYDVLTIASLELSKQHTDMTNHIQGN